MAVTHKWYGMAFKTAFNAEVDVDTHTDKVTLHSNSYTPNYNTNKYYTDLAGELSTANGYTNTGVALTTVVNGTPNTPTALAWDWDSDDPTWTITNPGITFYFAVYRDTNGSQPLLSCVDLGGATAIVSGNLALIQDGNGIAKVTYG